MDVFIDQAQQSEIFITFWTMKNSFDHLVQMCMFKVFSILMN